MNDRLDYRRGETHGTLEPKSKIGQALAETEGETDEAAQMKIIRAIAADVDGALTDSRAIRTLLESIADQPDEKARLKAAFMRKR